MSAGSFRKMHGLGNDFAVFDARSAPVHFAPAAIRAIADRRHGIGCDQVIVMEVPAADRADVFMRIYNADGGEVSACGNATRCVARILMEERGDSGPVIIATRADLLECWAADAGERVAVALCEPRFAWQAIPLAEPHDTAALTVPGAEALGPGRAVNVGNPHIVFFPAHPGRVKLAELGPKIERAPLFPEGVNVSIAAIAGENRLALAVWERGAGETLACGTAAIATAVAAMQAGHVSGPTVAVTLPGGTLDITWRADNHIVKTGPAALAFTGRPGPDLLPAEEAE